MADDREMLAGVHRRLCARIDPGLGLHAIEVAAPTADFEAFWNGGFIGPERFVEMNMRGMTGD